MVQAFLITLREGLEMALIVVIILAYVKRTGRTHFLGWVWRGVILAAAVSLLGGATLFGLGIGLEGKAEEVFEGSAMFLAVLVLTWVIIWMRNQARYIRGRLEDRVEQAIVGGSAFALASIAFLAVGREGLEMALFLFSASRTATPLETIVGGLVGLAGAITLGMVLYRGSHRINLRNFFNITGILLILFAAGLLTRGIHEFQEVGYLPVVIEHVWDINNVLSEQGVFGSFLKGLFGYNGNPSLIEVVAYPAYLALVLTYFIKPGPIPAGKVAERPSA